MSDYLHLRREITDRDEKIIDLRREIERLQARYDGAMVEQLRLDGEIEQLTVAIERLMAALREIEHETGDTMLATNHGRRGRLANKIARRALEEGK